MGVCKLDCQRKNPEKRSSIPVETLFQWYIVYFLCLLVYLSVLHKECSRLDGWLGSAANWGNEVQSLAQTRVLIWVSFEIQSSQLSGEAQLIRGRAPDLGCRGSWLNFPAESDAISPILHCKKPHQDSNTRYMSSTYASMCVCMYVCMQLYKWNNINKYVQIQNTLWFMKWIWIHCGYEVHCTFLFWYGKLVAWLAQYSKIMAFSY